MNKKTVEIKNKKFKYSLKRKKGARSIKLAIYSDGNFVVTAPRWYPLYVINRFIEEKAEWIFDKLKNIDFKELYLKKKEEGLRYKKRKELVRNAIKARIDFFNQHYNFSYNRISIKNQKTCWGSASQKGNLNFNYKVIDLPEELQDYIIVHELCHLKELNHSQKFWELVGETMRNHKDLRDKLKDHRI